MRNKLATSGIAWMVLTGLILETSTGFAASPVSITVETAEQVAALNVSGATYKPPSNATFPGGPSTVVSGTSVNLTGGPGASNADTILLVLSTSSLASLGAGTIGLTFEGLSPVSFTASDFFSTTLGGFPSRISGIGNGQVNGISFPGADHAAADIIFSEFLTKNSTLGAVTITSPINLRVDVFGDANGLIVGNASNGGAEGITPVPEPDPMALFGIAAISLMGVLVVHHRLHGCAVGGSNVWPQGSCPSL
jgi:hypothetical protein